MINVAVAVIKERVLAQILDMPRELRGTGTIFHTPGFDIYSYNMNKWLEYFLSFILAAFEQLSEEINLVGIKKETKTRRIEKVINSTLGYFTKDDIRNQCPDIPEPTINRVFNNLRKSGKIEVVAKGRSAKWKKK